MAATDQLIESLTRDEGVKQLSVRVVLAPSEVEAEAEWEASWRVSQHAGRRTQDAVDGSGTWGRRTRRSFEGLEGGGRGSTCGSRSARAWS